MNKVALQDLKSADSAIITFWLNLWTSISFFARLANNNNDQTKGHLTSPKDRPTKLQDNSIKFQVNSTNFTGNSTKLADNPGILIDNITKPKDILISLQDKPLSFRDSPSKLSGIKCLRTNTIWIKDIKSSNGVPNARDSRKNPQGSNRSTFNKTP